MPRTDGTVEFGRSLFLFTDVKIPNILWSGETDPEAIFVHLVFGQLKCLPYPFGKRVFARVFIFISDFKQHVFGSIKTIAGI